MASRGVTDPQWMAQTAFSTAGIAWKGGIIPTLVAAGWTEIGSGDGLSAYSATDGTAITGTGDGANGADNDLAWWRLLSPDGERELVIQIIDDLATASTIRVKYSRADGFVGGSPSATQVPSATDEWILHGGGTDASPTGEATFATTATASVVQGFADAAAPYGFAFWNYDTAGTDNEAGFFRFMCDPVIPLLNRTGAADDDPYVWHCAGSASANRWTRAEMGDSVESSTIHPGWGLGDDGSTQELFGTLWLQHTGVDMPATSTSNDMAVSAWDASADRAAGPVLYGSADSGIKGMSSLMHWISGTYDATSARTKVYSADGGTRNYIRVADVILPWNGSTPNTFTTETLEFIDFPNDAPEPASPVIAEDTAPGAILVAAVLGYDVTQVDDALIRVVITAEYGADYIGGATEELIYDGAFTAAFVTLSTAGAIADGFEFALERDEGWPSSDVTITVRAIDSNGNETVESFVYTVSDFDPAPAGGGDPPAFTAIDPPQGESMARFQPKTFTLEDDIGISFVVGWVRYRGERKREVIYDGDGFVDGWARLSTTDYDPEAEAVLSADFSVIPDDGWQKAVEEFRFRAIDSGGQKDEE